MPTLYLIRGVPGSGKSTFAQQMKRNGMVSQVFEADQYFIDKEGNYQFDVTRLGAAHGWCQDRAEMYLLNGQDVAVSNTSTTEKEVEMYRKITENAGASFVSIVMENRHGGENVHNVPADKVQQMKNRFSIKL